MEWRSAWQLAEVMGDLTRTARAASSPAMPRSEGSTDLGQAVQALRYYAKLRNGQCAGGGALSDRGMVATIAAGSLQKPVRVNGFTVTIA